MKHIKFCFVALVALIASQSYASTVQVDSTYFATGSQLVTFETGISQVLPKVAGLQFVQELLPSNFYGTGGSGLFGIMGFTNIVGDPFGMPIFSDLAINFTTPINAVGAWIGNIPNFLESNESLVTFSLFDTSHNLLAKRDINLLGVGSSPIFQGFSSTENIGRMEWNGNNGGFFAIDNLQFNQVTTVPNPPTWMLLCAGSILMCLKSKRAKIDCALQS